MFKRNLFKRVLPIMLSVAMVFQSVPITALAVENPEAVVSTTEAAPEADETTSLDGDSGSASDSSDDANGTSDSDKVSEETTEVDDGGTETTDAETESNGNETDEDTALSGPDEQVAVASTEIIVDESRLSLGSGFVRDNSADRLTYIVPYSVEDLFDNVINAVKDVADFKVNGESVPALKDDYLSLEWKEIKKAEDGKETSVSMTGTPQNVGSYALHLVTRKQEGICGEAECDVYFNITPKKLTIALEGEGSAEEILSVKAGSKIEDFKADIKNAVKLKDGSKGFDGLQYSSIVKVYKVGEEAETTDISFSKDGDYKVKVEVVLDAAAMNNYEVTGGEYLVRFDGLMQTRVDVGIENPGREIVKAYEKSKTYKASEIAAEYGITAVVKAVGTDGQDVPFGDDVADADKQAVLKWYTKEITDSSITEFPTEDEVDGITQFFWQNALYTMMTEESVGDVGEYYLVYVYEGVDGRYDKSHSDPVKVTIDPIEVILVPTKVGELNTGMTPEGIRKALAEVASELRVPDPADATLAGAVKSDAPAGDKDFYGVSYDDADVTQYYSPVFELMYKSRTRLPEAQWPAGATEDQKWSKWTALSRTADLKVDNDKTQYKYFIRFTGKKGIYAADGSVDQDQIRSVAEATDSANRNYKVKADSDTLDNEKNMLEVTLGEATKTTVDVSAIIAEFNKEGGRGMGGGGLTAEDPAWTIYDPDAALFADRASYKKAVVTSEIKDTHKDIAYTWEIGGWDQYYELTRITKNPDETDEDFARRKESAVKALENSFETYICSPYIAPYDAGIYRLHIEYKDSALVPKNAPAEGYAYFLIKKQELMLVADTQYAKYGESVDDFSKQGYSIYAIPGNNESALDLNSAEPLDWQTRNPRWQAMNLKKNADGSDSAEWENSTGTFIKNDTRPYVYKAAVWLNDSTGTINDTKGESVKNKAGETLNWSNYTTRNMSEWDGKDAYRQHYKVDGEFGVIKFDAGEIAVVVDRSKLFDDKIYDGKTIADALPEGFVKLTNKATGVEIPATELKVNGEPQDGVGTVRVEWAWSADNNPEQIVIVPTGEVKYGGTYALVASFEGNDIYGPLRANDDWSERWVKLEDKDGNFEFEIKPLDVEITPILKEETAAGECIAEMLEDWHVDVKAVAEDRKIPDGTDGSSDDRWLFERGDGEKWNAFTGEWISYSDSYPILDSGKPFSSTYYEDNKEVKGYKRIRYGRRYDVKLSNNNALFAQYDASYNLTFKSASPANIVRGEAEINPAEFFWSTEDAEVQGQVSVNTEKDKDGTYKIVPREGIPFVYEGYSLMAWNPQISNWRTVTKDLVTGKEIPLNKNYIAVNIVAPLEFSRELEANDSFAENNFVFGNSIKSANGYVIAEYRNVNVNVNRYYITALFPVELDESGKVVNPEKKFSVTWEEGYTENFNLDLTDAKLEADLKKAVAPKALAFNGVQGKMAVGEEQQLDVKITKAQLGDVIRIRYRLSGGETSNQYASINPDTGLITALATNNKKPVAVNVEAYPVRLAADGKTFEEITGKGVKVAKTKVTVTEVTAPVIKKVIPQDTYAEVQFTKVDNGYRGEIYVVKLANKKDANKWKAADFETAIGKMTNGQWQDTFAIAPSYFGGTRGYNEKLKICRQLVTFKELESSAYVVYVRNVSAVRTLADGSKVTESAAGTVKMFETTKSQVKELRPYFEVTAEKTKQNPVRYYDEKDLSKGYTVELADKSAQLLVDGKFFEKPSNAAADFNDYTWFQLSLKAAEKALGIKLTDKYQDPKLTYYVTDGEDPVYDEKEKLKNPSKYVTINNKGKLTFKGVDENGEVHVRVYVKADNGISSISDYCDLRVTARPDTLTTKKVKTMKVGDAVRLADYLEYKQGKAKVPYHWSSNIEITNWKEVEAAGFKIYQAVYNGETHPSIDGKLRKGEYIIIAARENSRCNLKFTDWLWKSGTDDKVQTEEKSISLSTSKLDSVKSLKAVYVDDKHITLNFAHAGHPEAFDIEVKDARGSVIYKKLAYRQWAINNKITADAKSWVQNMQRAILDNTNSLNSHFRYFEKTKMYAYTISTEKLMRLSSYTISVTPVYEGERAAKAAATKVKTTNIPASYVNCDVTNPEYNSGIYISNIFDEDRALRTTYFTSGNTYTLETWSTNPLAKARGTDTLTWKSSNTKVASIKANQGSFSATLKAMQQGKTTITVTSKVTKKTIARYHIAVKAVGKGTGYGGDYENGGNGFYDEFIKTVDPYYEGRLEVLTVSNPVNVTDEDMLNRPSNRPSNDRTWVQFTAPSYGEYTFACDSDFRIYYSNGTEADFDEDISRRTLRLEEGQKIYFRVEGTFKLRVSSYTDFTRLSTSYTKDKPLKVTRDMWVSFTAQEDNVYTFTGSGIEKYEKQPQVNQPPVSNGQFELGMKTGETVFIKVRADSELYVTKRDLSKTLAVGDAGASMSFTRDNARETQYVRFKADVTGDYSFTYSPSDEIDAKFLAVNDNTEYHDGDAVVAPKAKVMADSAEPGTPATPASRTVKLFMEGGETIVIAVTVINPAAVTGDKKIDVTVKAATTATKVLGGEQTVTKGTSQMFEYTIPDDKAATVYTVAATENAMVEWYYSKTEKEISNSWASDTQLGEITGIASNGNSFTVQNGKVVKPVLNGKKALNADDKIYIKVTAGDTADSKVTLTSIVDNKTFDAATPASIELGANSGDAQWYTFTVKKAGYYEFQVKATAVPAEAAVQNVAVKHVDKAFSDISGYPNISFGSGTSGVKKLSAGDYVFKISAASAAAEGVKTTAVLSVKEIVPTAIAKGDTQVTLAKDEVKYYSFKAATNDSYTIKWTPDAESGTAEAQYTIGSLESGSFNELPATVTSPTSTYYIKLTQTGEKAVSGKLQVVTDEKRFLTSGKEETFEIKENDGSIKYTFTTPEDSKLGYIVIVENTSSVDETKNQTMPLISVKENNSNIISNLGKGKASVERTNWDTAFITKEITITAGGVTEPTATEAGISATGKIMIRPVTAQALSETADKIMKADSKWYTYTIPADGRYMLDYTVGADQDKNSVDVRWYRRMPNGSKGRQINTEAYLEKGQELYVNVKAGDMIADAGVDVTLKTPALLQATELNLSNGIAEVDVTIPEGANAVYYTFKAPEYAKYAVSAANMGVRKYLPDKNGNDVDYYSGSTLEKYEVILIKVSAAGKLSITQDKINELEFNKAKEITLKANESAAFVLPIFADGYYDFRVSDAKGLSINADGCVYEDTENRCYFAAEVNCEESGNRYEFTVENTGEAEVKLTVTAGKLEPVDLKLGTVDVPVVKDRISITRFSVPEDYWYTVSCSAGSKFVEAYGSVISETFLNKDDELVGYLEYSGADAAGTAQVTISKLAPASVSGEKIALSLEAGESKWYAYRTTAAGEYTFTPPQGVRLRIYKSLSSTSVNSGSVKAGVNAEIYIRVTNNSGTKVEGEGAEVTVTKTGDAALLAHVDVRSGQYQWIIFQAPEDGTYTFWSTNNNDDPKAWFFRNQDVGDKANSEILNNVSNTDDGYGNNDDTGGDRNFMKNITLQAGETIYIAVGHYNLSNAISCDVYVTH